MDKHGLSGGALEMELIAFGCGLDELRVGRVVEFVHLEAAFAEFLGERGEGAIGLLFPKDAGRKHFCARLGREGKGAVVAENSDRVIGDFLGEDAPRFDIGLGGFGAEGVAVHSETGLERTEASSRSMGRRPSRTASKIAGASISGSAKRKTSPPARMLARAFSREGTRELMPIMVAASEMITPSKPRCSRRSSCWSLIESVAGMASKGLSASPS